jgi:hypothetical protein
LKPNRQAVKFCLPILLKPAVMKIYNFPEMTRGDSFDERSIKFTINDVDVDFSIATNKATIQFRYKNKFGKLYKELTIGSGLAANDPAVGWIKIEEFETDTWPAGTYYYDVELDLDGSINTYIGGTMKVLQDTTRLTT